MRKNKFLPVVALCFALLISCSIFAQDFPGRPNRPGGQNRPGGRGGRPDMKEMVSRAVLQNIHSRKSVRSFNGVVVSKDTLELLVKAGMAAPSAMNRQPWQFFATNDAKVIDAAMDKLGRNGKMIKEAGAVIVVLGEPTVSEKFWAIDGSCAAQNILLAIEAMKLGGVWLSAYPNEERMSAINEAFNIPSEYKVLCVIPVGHPKNAEQPKNKWNKEKFHLDKW